MQRGKPVDDQIQSARAQGRTLRAVPSVRIDNRCTVRIVAPIFRVGDMTKEQILAFCVDRIADLLRIPKEVVDTQTKFSRLGLDSATAVYLLMDLEEKLDLELSPEAFYDHPTVDNLSDYLAGKHAARAG